MPGVSRVCVRLEIAAPDETNDFPGREGEGERERTLDVYFFFLVFDAVCGIFGSEVRVCDVHVRAPKDE